MATVLIVLNGVLRDAKGQPITEGVNLYRSLAEFNRLIVAVEHEERDAQWLQIEGLTDYQELAGETAGSLRGHDLRISQVDDLLGRGHHVTLVVTGDPGEAARVLHRGIATLLFAHPKFSRPEHRPDFVGGVRPWADMVAEIETQTRLENTLRPVGEQ